jgi:uncharacterized protein (DUF885 family)
MRHKLRTLIFTTFSSILLTGSTAPSGGVTAQASAPGGIEARREQLKNVIAEEWEFELRDSPLAATEYGDYRYNDKIDDLSPAHALRTEKELETFRARVNAIDVTGFPEQDQLNKTLLAYQIHDELEAIALKNYEMPLDQINGIHLYFAQLPSLVPLDSVKHYEDYLARLRAIPAALGQLIESLKLGERDGLMPPRFLLEKVAVQCNTIAAAAGEASPFAVPVAKFPASFPAEEQNRLRVAVLEAIDTRVRPSYTALGEFVREDYAPKGRTEPGVWALPDGDARYRAAVRQRTTTDMTPEQIYELGLRQVKQIEVQMNGIAQQQGFPDWKSFGAAIQENPKMKASSREQVLDTYRRYIAQMQPKLPQLFGRLPKTQVEVVAVEAFREKEAAGAQYQPGTPDGSRPGKVYVNTGDYQDRTLPEMEATAYHEGIPGHHMQLSIQQEVPDLPAFRQHAFYGAFIEGWALYAERLGKELGFYQDPSNDFARLGSELFRAARLVEDTGVHYKHWTREQMVQFFQQNSLEAGADLQAEVDRYIAWPGQALSYKLGQLKFLELRSRAQDQLGDRFDIRAFHDEMLSGGAMPLNVLDERTNRWIASVKAKSGTTAGH